MAKFNITIKFHDTVTEEQKAEVLERLHVNGLEFEINASSKIGAAEAVFKLGGGHIETVDVKGG